MPTTSPFGRRHMDDDEFYNVQGAYVDKVTAKKVDWGISTEALAVLTDRRAEYEPLYHKAKDKATRTRPDVAAHRDCRKIYEKELRDFHNENIAYNVSIPDEEKLTLGGRERDIQPSPGSPITSVPIIGLFALGGGDMEVRARTTTDQTRCSMHPDADVLDYRYILTEAGDVPPSDPEDCPKGDSQTKAKFVLRVGAKNAGKRFYGFFRWLNNRRPRQEGPWSAAQSIIVG